MVNARMTLVLLVPAVCLPMTAAAKVEVVAQVLAQAPERVPPQGWTDGRRGGTLVGPGPSVRFHFGPRALPVPESDQHASPDEGWNVIFRLHVPPERRFDKSWQPGEIEEVASGTAGIR